MNKIFKVLWNRARGTNVVTDETRTAHGKGRQGATTIDQAPCAVLWAAIAAASLGASLSAWGATTITTPTDWNHTTVTNNGNVWNVTTNKYVNNGQTGINQFDKFTIDKGSIANLQMGKGSQLLNLVNQHITVDGVVNAIKDNKIGGDLIFVSPTGMTVGTTGVINAGSLTAVAASEKEFKEMVTFASLDGSAEEHFTADYLERLSAGEVPLNPKGVITVAGSINAGNRVALAARTVKIEKDAVVRTGVDDFSKLVNITDETDAISVDSGLSAENGNLVFQPDDESGDILLIARADESASGVTIAEDPNNPDKGTTDTGSIVASIDVEAGASIDAKRDVAIRAEAGNGEWNAVSGAFETSDAKQSDDVRASVSIQGSVTAGRDLDVSAKAFNLLEHDSTYNLAAVSENLQNAFLGGLAGSTVEWVDMSAAADVTIGSAAKLTAKRDASVTAETVLNLAVGDSTGFLNYSNIGTSLPVVAVAAAQADASSSVTIDGVVRAGEDLTIEADTDFDVEVMTKAVAKEQQTEFSFVYAGLNASSEVNLSILSEVGALEGQTTLGDVTISANTANRVETAAETYAYKDGSGSIGVAGNVTLFDSSADVNLESGLDGTAKSIAIGANNTTETIDVLSKTTTGDLGIIQKFQAKAVSAALDKVLGGLADKVKGAGGAGNNLNFNLGGSAAYVENHQSAGVTVYSVDEGFHSSGNLSVTSNAILDDYHYEVTTKQVVDAQSTAKGQGAVAVLVSDSDASADLTVKDGTALESTSEDVNLTSTVEINKDRWQFLTEEYIRSCETLLSYFSGDSPLASKYGEVKALADNVEKYFKAIGEGGDFGENLKLLGDAMTALANFLTSLPEASTLPDLVGTATAIGFDLFDIVNPASYTNAYVSAGGVTSDAENAPVSVAASVGVVNQKANASVSIGKGASVTGQNVAVNASTRNEGVAMGGYLDNFIGVPLPNRDNAKALGATVVYQTFEGGSTIRLEEGGSVAANSGDATVDAMSEVDAATIAASAGYNKGGLTLSGIAAVTKTDGNNVIEIDDEASVSAADNLTVAARRNDSLQTVAGGLNLGIGGGGSANASVGAGVAVNLGGLANSLEVKDIDGTVNRYHGAGSLSGDAVSLFADADANVNAIGVEGQAAVSSSKGDGATNAAQQLENLGEGDFAEEIVDQETMLSIWEMGQSQSGVDTDMGWIAEGASRPAGTTPDISTPSGQSGAASQAQSSKNSLNLAAAGSFAWNDFNLGNTVSIDSSALENDGVFTIEADTLSIEALTDKWMGSFAGAAGISAVTGGSSTVNGSIGGAAAINKNVFTNAVTINGLKTTADTMSVASLVNGTTVAEGLGLSVAGGQSTVSLGINAGVSYNDVKNTVSTSVTGLVNESEGEFVYDQAAWTGETQVTGGTAVGVSAGKTSFSGSFGAAVAVTDIENNVTSTLSDSTLTNAKSVDVVALASLTQVNTAVSGQVGVSSGGAGVSLSGAVITAGIDNAVTASASDSTITVADCGSVDIRAATANTGEGGEAAEYAERVAGIDGIVSRDDLIDASLTGGVTLKDDESDDSAHDITADYLNGADMTQVSVALGLGVAVGSSGSGAGAAGVVVTDFTNDFKADSTNLTVKQATEDSSFTYAQTAASGVSTVTVSAGIAASGGGSFGVGLAGSVVVSGVQQTTGATADGLTLELGDHDEDDVAVAIGAQNDASTVNVAGNVSATIGSNGAGLGAAVVVADVANTADATLENSNVAGGGALALTAHNAADTWAAAANAVVSANAALGGSYAQNRVTNNAGVHASNDSLAGLDAFRANASDESLLRTLSGSVSVAYSPNGGASLAGGIAVMNAGGATEAQASDLVIKSDAETSETDVSVAANAEDDIRTLTLGTSVAAVGAGAGNATAINSIDRTVNASLDGLSVLDASGNAWTGDRRLGEVAVKASSNADISNLGIVIGVGGIGAGAGVGVSLNDVSVDVSTTADHVNATLDTLEVAASSSNDIETIGVGVTAAAGAGIGGSSVEATFGGDVWAELKNSTVTADGALAVHAASNDTVGLYGGQASGGGAALGVTVGFVDRFGATTARVTNSTVTETGAPSSTLTVAGGVKDEFINDDVAEDVRIGASLSDPAARETETVDGILVSAMSTATYKTLVINGGGAGTAQAGGSGLTVTHGGATSAVVNKSTLTGASDVSVLAGDYANFFTSLTNVGGATTASANLGVALVETAHETSAEASETTLAATNVTLEAESKEGVSSLMTAGSGAMTAAGAATASKTDLHSSVSTALRSSTVTGTNYTQHADYLGRISNLGVSAAVAAAGGASVSLGANVVLNSVDNRISSEIDGSTVASAGTVDVDAHRALDWREYGGTVSVSVSQIAASAAGTVLVNEVEGETAVKISGESTVGTENTQKTSVTASNDDEIEITTVTTGISTGVAAGVTVAVNEITDTAGVLVENSALTGADLSVEAQQNRTVSGTVSTVTVGLWGGVTANVVATTIGEKAENYQTLFGGEEGAGGEANSVEGLVDEYGDYDKSTLVGMAPGKLGDSNLNPPAEGQSARADESGESMLGGANGTKVILANATLQGTTVKVRADEDASGTGVDLTLGSGTAGALAANAGVAVLHRHHNAGVEVAGGSVTATNLLDLGAAAHAVDKITVWQAGAGLVSGTAAYAEADVEGAIDVNVEKASISSGNGSVAAENASSLTVDSNGIALGAVAAGGMIAKITDASDVSVTAKDSTFTGSNSIAADRGQSLTATALAGYGGALAGVGAKADVEDKGNVVATLSNVTAENGEASGAFAATGDNHVQITADAMAAGGALGAAVGVVQGYATVSGATQMNVSGGRYTADSVTFEAMTGRDTGDAGDALSLSSHIQGYGGAVVASVGVNEGKLTNNATTSLSLSGADFGTNTTLKTLVGGHADYNLKSDAVYAGGLLATGSTRLSIGHNQATTMNLSATDAVLKSLDADVQNSEDVDLLAESAGGALLALEDFNDAVRVSHADRSNAKLTVGGQWTASDRIDLGAATAADVGLSANNTKGGLGVLSGATASNSLVGETSVTVADGASLKTGNDLSIKAHTDWSVHAAEGESHVVSSEVYGGIAGTGIRFEGTVNRSNAVTVGNASLDAGGSLFAEATSTGTTDIHVLSRAGALAAVGVNANLQHNIDVDNTIEIESGAVVRSRRGDGSITFAASSDDNFTHEALTRTAGVIDAAGSSTTGVRYDRNLGLTIEKGANVLSGGALNLYAGANANGEDAWLHENNRVEIFSDVVVSFPKTTLDVKTNLTDTVNVAGYAGSTTNTSVIADSGWWEFKSDNLTHYWGSLGSDNNVELIVEGMGEALPGMTEENALNVSGTLEAGLVTKVDITIDGIFGEQGASVSGNSHIRDWADGVTVESTGNSQLVEDIKESIKAPASESTSNIYWDRYKELQSLIASYQTGQGDASADVVAVWRAELSALEATMISEGYATQVPGANGQLQTVPASSTNDLYVTVGNLTVSGGSIDIATDKVTGAGSIQANAAEGISITNHSNASLKVEDVHIYEKGGDISLNGAGATTQTLANAGFAGQVALGEGAENPTISIESDYSYGSYNVTIGDGTQTVNPSPNLVVSGTIENRADEGDITLKTDGSIISLGSLSAAGDLNLEAQGSILQSYMPGVTDIGGGIAGSDAWDDLVAQIIASLKDGSTTSEPVVSTDAEDPLSTGGTWVAGGNIIISGDMLNLNGLIQSGFSKYEISLTDAELADRIAEITAAWKKAGSPQNFDLRSSAYQIQKGEAVLDGKAGLYKYNIGCWYDPVNQRIVLDDIVPEGGNIYISGKVASTGNGRIYALDGAASVRLNAGNWSVQTGEINTGNASGVIRITDSFFADTAQKTSARVTEYRDGQAQTWLLDLNGEEKGARTDTDAASFRPMDGLLYVWTEGYKNTSHKVQTTKYEGSWWGADDYDWDSEKVTYNNTTQFADDLSQGGTIVKGNELRRPSASGHDTDSNFYAWVEKTTTNDMYSSETDTWSSGLFGFYKHKLVTETWDTGWTAVGTFTVQADHKVTVGTLPGGDNVIDISTNKDLFMGGTLRADGGSVSLTATNGSISSLSNSFSISGANSVALTAGRDIGAEGGAIRLTGGSGALNLRASAQGNIFLDGTNLSDGRVVNASALTAGETLDVAVRDGLNVTTMRGRDISLVSNEGGIKVADLVQAEKLDGTQRFDASAAGDIELTVTQGDLGIGLVQTTGGDVRLTLNEGLLFDADEEDESSVSTNDRLESWIAAGLINADGSSAGAAEHTADLQKAEDAVKSRFERYQGYLKDYLGLGEGELKSVSDLETEIVAAIAKKFGEGDLSNQMADDFRALHQEFQGAGTVEEAVAMSKESGVLKQVAETSASRWSQNELLYAVADSIINGTETGERGSANIIASGDVVITATGANGAVGTLGLSIEGSLAADAGPDERLEVLKFLSKADVGDFAVESGTGMVSVNLKSPVTIAAEGTVSVGSTGNIFIETPQQGNYALNIGRLVSAAGDVRLASGNGIFAAVDNLISGNTVTLRAGNASLGTADALIKVHSDEWTAASSTQDIFLEAVNEDGSAGDMTVYSIAGGADVTVKAENLYAYEGNALEGYEDFDTLGYIHGGSAEDGYTITFNVAGDFGKDTENGALRVGSDSIVLFEETIGNLYLDALGVGNLRINRINASGAVRINGEDSVTVGLDDAAGGVKGSDVSIKTANDLTVKGNVESTSETGSAVLTAQTGSVTIADGSTVSAAGDVSISAGDAATFNLGTIEAGNTVTVAVGTGGIEAAGLTLQAGSTANFTSAGIISVAKSESGKASSFRVKDEVVMKAEESISSSDAIYTATDGNVSFESTQGSIDLANTELTAKSDTNAEGGNVTVTAADKATLTDSIVRAAVDLGVTAGAGGIAANGVDVDAGSGANFTSAGAISVAKGTKDNAAKFVVKDEVHMTAKDSIVSTDAYYEATAGNLFFQSEEGDVELANSTLVAKKGDNPDGGDLTIKAKGSAGMVGTKFTLEGALDIEAETGDIDLSGAEGTDFTELVLHAGRDLGLDGLDVTVDERFDVSAGRDVHADELTLTAEGESADVTVKAETGSVELADATFAWTESGFLGDVTITAQKDVDAENLFAKDKNFTSETLAVTAEDGTLTLGDGPQSMRTETGDLKLAANALDGDKLAAGSELVSEKGAVGITLDRGALSVLDDTTIRGETEAMLSANGSVAMTGDVLLTANEKVSVTSETGSIAMTGAVTVGDETIGESGADVTLAAKNDITQNVTTGDGGVRGSTLTASAETGDVHLGATHDESVPGASEGNAFSTVTVESAGDVVYGTNGRDATVTVNAQKNGAVAGDLKLYGYEAGFALTNDVAATGDVLVNASAMHGQSLTAGDRFEVLAALYDDSIETGDLSGVSFTGDVSGTHVAVFTDAGDIALEGKTTSTESYVDVYRLSTTERGDVSVNEVESPYTVTLYNGNGDVTVKGPVKGFNTVYSFTGSDGRTIGEENLESWIHKQGAVDDAENFSDQFDFSKFEGLQAGGLGSVVMPHLVFDESALSYADIDRISPFVFPMIETLSPSDEYFFLHLRSDAAAHADDEETVLEEGLPARDEPVITDHRKVTPQTLEELGLILSQR